MPVLTEEYDFLNDGGVHSLSTVRENFCDEPVGVFGFSIGMSGVNFTMQGSLSDYILRMPVATPPTTNTSSGQQGDWAWDGIYLYWCVNTNEWVRWIPIRVWD